MTNGLLGAAGLLAFYFIVLRLTNSSWDHAIEQFGQLWFWMLLLDLGFGIQIGLYTYLRNIDRNENSAKIASTSAGVSAGSMVACCAHHVSDVLPIIGLSSISIFLTEYQVWFIILGIVSNFLGIGYIAKQIMSVSVAKREPAIIYSLGKEVVRHG